MADPHKLKLAKAPIIEAVLDFDCDMPAGFDLAMLERAARDRLEERYPKVQLLHEHQIELKPDAPSATKLRHGLQALRFMREDEKQLVQVRARGYSFNRLAPYSSLDDYLPEIERTWRLYAELASAIQVKVVRLRYINRILLPLEANKVDLDAYIRVGPRSPEEEKLMLISFLNQYVAVEKDTPYEVTVVSTSQAPEGGALPVILDISAASTRPLEPGDWTAISRTIQALRSLKNRVFVNSLTEQCFRLFQ